MRAEAALVTHCVPLTARLECPGKNLKKKGKPLYACPVAGCAFFWLRTQNKETFYFVQVEESEMAEWKRTKKVQERQCSGVAQQKR